LGEALLDDLVLSLLLFRSTRGTSEEKERGKPFAGDFLCSALFVFFSVTSPKFMLEVCSLFDLVSFPSFFLCECLFDECEVGELEMFSECLWYLWGLDCSCFSDFSGCESKGNTMMSFVSMGVSSSESEEGIFGGGPKYKETGRVNECWLSMIAGGN